MTNLQTAGDLDDLVRNDAGMFLRRAFHSINPGERLEYNWHLDAMLHALEKVRLGRTQRLIITVPPRHLKSITTSVAFCARAIALDPSLKILVASYGADLAKKHAHDFNTVAGARWHSQAFPRLGAPVKMTEDKYMTSMGGGRYAASLGGTLTGIGADIIIVDDILKSEDTASALGHERARTFYQQTLVSRLNDLRTGRFIVIQQRLHQDDLVGFLLERGGYEHLNLPAVAERDEWIELSQGRVHHRRVGDVLSQRLTGKVLENARAEMGPRVFAAQYQQNPVAEGGALIRWNRFRFYDEAPDRDQCTYVVQSWDTASSPAATADFSVCTTWGFHQGAWKLLDLVKRRLDFPELLALVRSLRDAWKVDVVLIEQASSGHALLQELQAEQRSRATVRHRVGESTGWHVRRYIPKVHKTIRMETQAAKLEDGRALLPRSAPWLDDLRAEMIAFPSERDDQVDSISQFLEEMTAMKTSHARPRGRIGQL